MIVLVNRGEITADVAARLVAAQFPQWAGLPVTLIIGILIADHARSAGR